MELPGAARVIAAKSPIGAPCSISSPAQKSSLLANVWCMRPGDRDFFFFFFFVDKLCKRQSRTFVILVATPNVRSKTSGCKNKRLGKIIF